MELEYSTIVACCSC